MIPIRIAVLLDQRLPGEPGSGIALVFDDYPASRGG
jgi:hypothetical protein